MAVQENFFVVPYRNPDFDSGLHYFVFHPPENKVLEFLQHFLIGHKNVQIDLEQKFASYPTKTEAEEECRRLGDIQNQIDPERIDASTLKVPNLALEPGKLKD